MIVRSLLVCATFAAVPAVAEEPIMGRFYPPAGCTEKLTVQKRACEVDNIWTCSKDAPGDQWRATFTPNGMSSFSKIDREGQWIESYRTGPMRRTYLIEAKDPASLTDLFESGVDTMDFTQFNGSRGTEERVVGVDTLTGEQVVIDGETLLRTEFSLKFFVNGEETLSVSGSDFASEKFRRFFLDYHEIQGQDRSVRISEAPVDFIYPGEPGFFATLPLYDCEAEMARFVPPAKGTDQ